ncbi:uncharacterized protein LOC109851088 isoform X2 [Asparagus officinalis]|uniref:uncharacterized protein LOC109851088 isoform X2 n=1 Tax=Asparagus officinalis TaxID=4686 RepID=UPI00098DE456|nr:uncharacterized protein LOC109851088 isoform X2 [Asparagus officinalis]
MDNKLWRQPFPADYMDPKQSRRCFNCGDDRHSVKFCPKGAFICFNCHEEGHIAKNCRSHLRPSEKKVDLSASQTLCNNSKVLATFAILTITEGSPSLELIKVRLSSFFNWSTWHGKVIPLVNNRYLVEFPSLFQLSESVEEKALNFDAFKGWFAPWNENVGMKKVDSAFYQWLKIKNLPLHFWSIDILEKIVESFGELVRGCKNITDKLNGQDVRILVKVKSADCIPKTVVCSYISQIDSFTREVSLELIPIGAGQLGSEVIDTQLSAMQAQGDVVLDSKWEGQISMPIAEQIKNATLIDQNKQANKEVDKGKQVMIQNSNVAEYKGSSLEKFKEIIQKNTTSVMEIDSQEPGQLERVNAVIQDPIKEAEILADTESTSEPHQDLPFDLIKHSWKDKIIYIEKSTWEAYFGGNKGASNSISSSTSFPPNSNQTPAIQSSSSVPPGFSKKISSSSVARVRRTTLNHKHRSFLNQAISAKKIIRPSKKGAKAEQVLAMLEANPLHA